MTTDTLLPAHHFPNSGTSHSETSIGETSSGNTDPHKGKWVKDYHHHNGGTTPVTTNSLKSGKSGFTGMHFLPPSTNGTASAGSSTASTGSSDRSTTTNTAPPSWVSKTGLPHHSNPDRFFRNP